jgi:hypothetical protein
MVWSRGVSTRYKGQAKNFKSNPDLMRQDTLLGRKFELALAEDISRYVIEKYERLPLEGSGVRVCVYSLTANTTSRGTTRARSRAIVNMYRTFLFLFPAFAYLCFRHVKRVEG